MEPVIEQKLEKQQVNGRSLHRVAGAAEFLGITKRSNHSSGSRFSYSTYSGAVKNKDGIRRRNDNTLKSLFFVFIFRSRRWLRMEAKETVNIKVCSRSP